MLRDQMNQMDPIRSNKGVAALNLDNEDIAVTATLNWKYCFVLSLIDMKHVRANGISVSMILMI